MAKISGFSSSSIWSLLNIYMLTSVIGDFRHAQTRYCEVYSTKGNSGSNVPASFQAPERE